MSHARALLIAGVVSSVALLAECAPAARRWRWRVVAALLGVLLGLL